jgi:uncharacterized protein
MTSIDIQHDAAAMRFHAVVAGGEAECLYRLAGSLMNIVHTEVPAQAEGQGIAAALVRAALAHARAAGWRVRPSCSYVHSHMRRHADALDLLE